MQKMISEIINEVAKEKAINKKAELLRKYDSSPLRTVLQYALDSRVKWLLPKGKVPYKKVTEAYDNDGLLYSEARRLYLFVEGGNPNLKQARREQLFIQLLESLPAAEAELLCMAKDKKLPTGISAFVVNKAFPDFIYVEQTKEEKNEQV